MARGVTVKLAADKGYVLIGEYECCRALSVLCDILDTDYFDWSFRNRDALVGEFAGRAKK